MQRFFAHFFLCEGVIAEIFLQADKEDGDAGATLIGFFDPLHGASQLKVNGAFGKKGTLVRGKRDGRACGPYVLRCLESRGCRPRN